MSQENLVLVRSIYAAWERADFSSAEWADADIDFVDADGVIPHSRTGVAGMAESWRTWLSAWQGYYVEADEYRELDDERVLVLAHPGGHGKSSGLQLDETRARGATRFHVRDRKVTRLVLYADRNHALADLGLASSQRRRCRRRTWRSSARLWMPLTPEIPNGFLASWTPRSSGDPPWSRRATGGLTGWCGTGRT